MVEHAPWTPGWVDLAAPDPAAAARFYTGLFGWTADQGVFRRDGQRVAGFGPPAAPGAPAAWSPYVVVPDPDATLRAVDQAGGKVLVPPVDRPAFGRAAVFADREGAPFSVWRPAGFAGAEVVGEPGSFCWAELASRDQPAAEEFYGAALGWQVGRAPDAEHYATFRVGGREVAGLWDALGRMPDHVPVHWQVHFLVADVDGTAARATELGGEVRLPPIDLPAGRFAVLADPAGATFCVVRR